jgi:hypothetical protein
MCFVVAMYNLTLKKLRSIHHLFLPLKSTWGHWQGKVNKKNILPKIPLKNETFFKHRHKKMDSKYFEVEI